MQVYWKRVCDLNGIRWRLSIFFSLLCSFVENCASTCDTYCWFHSEEECGRLKILFSITELKLLEWNSGLTCIVYSPYFSLPWYLIVSYNYDILYVCYIIIKIHSKVSSSIIFSISLYLSGGYLVLHHSMKCWKSSSEGILCWWLPLNDEGVISNRMTLT